MTTARPGDRRPEKDVRLGFGEAVDIDVLFCDLVPGREHESPYQVRFRGYRAGTDEGIRFYCELDAIEGPMLHEQILRHHVTRPDAMNRDTRAEIPLEQHALTIERYRVGNGTGKYRVTVRDDRDVKRFARAVEAAADTVVPVLRDRGFAVSGADVITVARELVRGRTPQG